MLSLLGLKEYLFIATVVLLLGYVGILKHDITQLEKNNLALNNQVVSFEALAEVKEAEAKVITVKEDGLEIASWDKQESEARAWMMDNATSTPLIDALLVGRNLGESKEEFVNKIITKADAYKAFYGQILGKLHAKQKELEASKTIEELKTIEW